MRTYLGHSIEVLDFEVRRQLELVADVVAALASVGDVDGEDEGLVAERLDAVHDLLRQFAVPVHVQLEPAVTVGCSRHDLLHRAGGVSAGDVAGVQGLCGCEAEVEKYFFSLFIFIFQPATNSSMLTVTMRVSRRAAPKKKKRKNCQIIEKIKTSTNYSSSFSKNELQKCLELTNNSSTKKLKSLFCVKLMLFLHSVSVNIFVCTYKKN